MAFVSSVAAAVAATAAILRRNLCVPLFANKVNAAVAATAAILRRVARIAKTPGMICRSRRDCGNLEAVRLMIVLSDGLKSRSRRDCGNLEAEGNEQPRRR